MRQIEEANKLELALSIKALVARALANELIEGGDVRYWPILLQKLAITGRSGWRELLELAALLSTPS
jgi:hypothetical protein